DVDRIHPELQLMSLPDLSGLAETEIEVRNPRPIEDALLQRSERARPREGEDLSVEGSGAGHRGAAVRADRRSRHHGRSIAGHVERHDVVESALVERGVYGVALIARQYVVAIESAESGADRKRKARLVDKDPAHLPSGEQRAVERSET